MFACNFITSGLDGNSPSNDSPPDNSQAPSNNGGQSPASGGGANYFQLPTSPNVPPADVLQQIAVAGGGGSDISCSSNCIVYEYNYAQTAEQNKISLTHFQPNQQLRIEVYYLISTDDQTAISQYQFLTELVVQTNNNGAIEIHVDGDFSYLPLLVLDENGNVLAQPETMQ